MKSAGKLINPDINGGDARQKVLGWLTLCSRMRTIKRVKGIPNFFYFPQHFPFNTENVRGYRLIEFEDKLVLKNGTAVIIPYLAIRYVRSRYTSDTLRLMNSQVSFRNDQELVSAGVMHCVVIAQNRNRNPEISTPYLIPMGRIIV